ncbi:MAG: nucleotide exchange factor GrpE [Burkholderiaceae bacterium]
MNPPNNDRTEPFIGGDDPTAGAGDSREAADLPRQQPTGPQAAPAARSQEFDLPDSDQPEPAVSSPETEIAQLSGEITQLKAQLAEMHDRQLRQAAEMENVRRRAADDVSKAHKFSIESFAESLIPVVDSLEMALKVESPTAESLKEGTEATLRQLMSAFEKNKLSSIEPAGEKFDPNLHQAISMVPSDAVDPPVPANHVATVLQKGYLINDRVLRPALVTVVQA